MASASQNRVDALLGKIRFEEARLYATTVAPRVSSLLNRAEEILAPVWQEELASQSTRLITYRAGDLLWRNNTGWAVCLADSCAKGGDSIPARLWGTERRLSFGFCVNVTELASRNVALLEFVQEFRNAVP